MNENMRISQNGIGLIKKWEGCRLVAYTDSVGVWTIGYGHTKGVYPGMVISQSQADAFLQEDIKTHCYGIYNYIKIQLNQNQFDAMASFHFNLGAYILNGTALLNFINAKQWSSAANEMKRYCNAGGKPVQGLINRRNEESALFLKSVSPSKPKPFTVNAIVRLSSGAKVTTSWSSNVAIPSSVTGQYYKVERVEPMSAKWDLSEYQVLISSYSNTFRAWVYEQDLALTSGAKYKKGQAVRLLSKAQYASRYSNRQAIGKNYLEEIFEIVDVAVTAESQSAFQYRIRHSTLGDIWVLEQDLGLWTSTHKVGDIIRLSGGAKVTTSWSSNSAIEPKYVNEFYKIERIEPLSEPKWTSNYQLLIFSYTNDFRKWVYEQDAYKPPAAKFKKEDQVILSTAAKKASKYWSQRVLESKYLGQQYKIVDVALTAESRSPYQYRLTHAILGDLWVLEQDLIKN